MMRHLDLFSGIGGFALGLESAGYYETVAFCEIEEYPRRVLKKHWSGVPCYGDIRELGADRLAADGVGRVDILTGGFPCQDISLAGARAGLSGERSGLWSELFRVVSEVRPRWVIAENVPGLRTLGADAVLADLAGAGYAAWPLVVGAGSAGASHKRKRVWVVAHANGTGLAQHAGQRGDPCQEQQTLVGGDRQWVWERAPEPVLRGMDARLPCGLHRRERLKALGNAVVPQIVAALGRAIIEVENGRSGNDERA